MTNSQSFDGVNTTKATTTEQPKDLVTGSTEVPNNYTLGTKLYLKPLVFYSFTIFFFLFLTNVM